ncbi:MAG: FAD-dependent oxidoreductase [Planctomycetota bacterium]|nr:FAD-dependent oxidoreductase [Planctomycetota bacterium]
MTNSPNPITPSTTRRRIAVIGAGVAGSAAARALHDHGHHVTLFDKGRGPGGRASTRRTDDHRFDHGAQYFTARDPQFKRLVESWIHEGAAAEWTARFIHLTENGPATSPNEPRYVGVPAMNRIVAHLQCDLNIHFNRRVASIDREANNWRLAFEDNSTESEFDALILAAPAPQSAALLEDVAPELAVQARSATMKTCWAAMLAFDEPLPLDFDAARVETNCPLTWIARDASKPHRADAETWILHASPEWSEQNLESSAESAARTLTAAFFDCVDIKTRTPRFSAAHRWRHALVDRPVGQPTLFDPALNLACCGDWLIGPRIESAFLSGSAAAGRILAALTESPSTQHTRLSN